MIKTFAAAAVALAAFAAPAYAQTAESLVGKYTYTGTETDGSKYEKPGEIVVKLAPSGALEVVYDGGEYVGIGQVSGSIFAMASVAEGKNSIALLTINPDGSLSGKWWRRTDKGKGGTEVWTKAK